MAARDQVTFNPRGIDIGRRHTILWGRARQHHVHEFHGPLSIKSVVRGAARWRVGRDSFSLDQRSFLVLNEDQPYSLTIDSPTPVETFIIFFQHGFAREVLRGVTISDARLLDEPADDRVTPAFRENVHPWYPPLLRELAAIRTAVSRSRPDGLWLDERFTTLAGHLVSVERGVRQQTARLPAASAAVREELYRRLRHGIDFIEGSLADPLDLSTVARVACISPFHFHRSFSRAFGETVHGYIRRRRLERACDLLATSPRSVTDVSLDVGFASLGSFSALFRAKFGMTPRQFRRANSKIGEEAEPPGLHGASRPHR